MPAGNEATGTIADLFASAVGFYPGWGFSRSMDDVAAKYVTSAGNVDWAAVDACVEEVLVDRVALPPSPPSNVPPGVYAFSASLFARVAVGQHFSGWAGISGRPAAREQLVLLRCHMGKRRAGKLLKNAVLMQYRVWIRTGQGQPMEVSLADEAWPLLENLHIAIDRALRQGRKGDGA